MKSYIGSKIIQAEVMDERSFLTGIKGQRYVDEDIPSRPGYKVVYPGGYISWSPQDAFETAYREITNSEKELIEIGN